MSERLTRIAIVSSDKCKPKKCRQQCKKSCPVVMTGIFFPFLRFLISILFFFGNSSSSPSLLWRPLGCLKDSLFPYDYYGIGTVDWFSEITVCVLCISWAGRQTLYWGFISVEDCLHLWGALYRLRYLCEGELSLLLLGVVEYDLNQWLAELCCVVG
jgi:hypothetical protein